MMDPNSLPYRPCVGVMLLNAQGLAFVGRRTERKGASEGEGQWWQMPQGGVDKGENESCAALRELEEEVGTAKAEIIAESKGYYNYDLPDDLVPHIWGGKFRGQQQKWFLMRFSGKDSDINIDTDDAEFCKWKWAPVDSLPDIIVPFKRKIYSDIVREFKPFLEC